MRNLKGFLIILLCLYIGQILSFIIPIPLPGTIYGMLIILLLLISGLLKLNAVESVAQTLISLMLLMFVPGGVKLISVYHLLDGILIKLFLVCFISTILILIATAITVDQLIEFQRRKKIDTK